MTRMSIQSTKYGNSYLPSTYGKAEINVLVKAAAVTQPSCNLRKVMLSYAVDDMKWHC